MANDKIMLIVDDMPVNRMVLRQLFCDEYLIMEADDGIAALETLDRCGEQVNVVLLDLLMPKMDGMGVLREIKKRQQDDKLMFISVVVISNLDDSAYALEAIKLGASEFVSRPIEPDSLAVRIRTAILSQENERLKYENMLSLKMKDKELSHEKEMRYNAEHDTVTGLLNKDAFRRRAEGLLKTAKPYEYVISVTDIDNFKFINNIFGHREGDKFLRYVANVIQGGIEEIGGLCCRMYADNFALIFEYDLANITFMNNRRKHYMQNSPLPIEFIAKTGRYIIEDPTLPIEVMIDRAMVSKNRCKGKYGEDEAYYTKDMYDSIFKEQELVIDMESALEKEEFSVFLQPQFNYKTSKIIGAEALVRWIHPKKGVIPPNLFIPIFERNGFISKLDLYVFKTVCHIIKNWKFPDKDDFYISVSLSRLDLFDQRFIEAIRAMTKECKILAKRIWFEVTESVYVENVDILFKSILALQDLGFKIEMDDFGSGYSSLNVLSDIPVDVLKLDMKFLEGSDSHARRFKIIGCIIDMSKILELEIIAEGVETKEQADYLMNLGCENMQGWYFEKAIPVSEFEKLYNKRLH